MAWRSAAARSRLERPTRFICCYPDEPGFVGAIAELIRPALAEARKSCGRPRLLLTAHGLPLRIVRAGDPTQGRSRRPPPLSSPPWGSRNSSGISATRAGSGRSNGSARRSTKRSAVPGWIGCHSSWRRSPSSPNTRRRSLSLTTTIGDWRRIAASRFTFLCRQSARPPDLSMRLLRWFLGRKAATR